MVPMRCSLCQQDDTLRETWGCTQPTQVPIWEHDGDLYYSCPLLYIPHEIIDWYYEYDYAKEFGTAPYEDMSYLWVWAASEYKREYNACVAQKNNEQIAKQNSRTAFRNAKMRGNDDG